MALQNNGERLYSRIVNQWKSEHSATCQTVLVIVIHDWPFAKPCLKMLRTNWTLATVAICHFLSFCSMDNLSLFNCKHNFMEIVQKYIKSGYKVLFRFSNKYFKLCIELGNLSVESSQYHSEYVVGTVMFMCINVIAFKLGFSFFSWLWEAFGSISSFYSSVSSLFF